MKRTCVLITLLLCGAMSQIVHAREKPNIVFILADDIGIESLKTYGGRSTSTPHIDQLAQDGMTFTHCFANPKCTPSRAEVLTGTYPSQNGMKTVLSHYAERNFLDPTRFDSFANLLKASGYRTAIAGKWNLSWLEKNNTLGEFGFDEHCMWQMFDKTGKKRSRYYSPYLRINNRIVEEEISDKFGPQVLSDFMTDFIRRNKEKPFLLFYPALLPHIPYIEPPGSDVSGSPKNPKRMANHCFPLMVNYLDKNVGALVQALSRNGIERDTIVIFCADNGTHHHVTSVWGERNQPIQGGKTTMTDRGSRVPLIIKWPGSVKAGSTCESLVEFADFLPTLGEVADAREPRQKVSGQSFLAQMKGLDSPARQWVHVEHGEKRLIRTKDWIFNNDQELIRVNQIGEKENRPEDESKHPEIRKRLGEILESCK